VSASSSTARSLIDPESIDGRQPVGAVVDGPGRPPEDADVTRIGQGRAGREIHEHFRRRLIEPENGDAIAGGDAQRGDPERAQPAIRLRGAGKFQNRAGHDWIWRLTSSTMRLDRRGGISIFAA
jgi:hypothetical protein